MAGTIVASTTASGSGSSLSINKPSGTADGDLMIIFHANFGGTYGALSPPAGWSTLTGLDHGINDGHFKVYTKAASGEGASYSLNQNIGSASVALAASFRGVNTSSGTWIWATPAWVAAGTPRVAPSVSGIAPGGLLVCANFLTMAAAAGWSVPADMVSLSSVQSGTSVTECAAAMSSAADPSGTKSFSVTGTQGSGGVSFSIGLQPVNAAGNFLALF